MQIVSAKERRAGHERARSCSFLVPIISAIDVTIFIITMYVNNCPQHSDGCVLRFLGRFSFQPFRDNPLLGPSSSTLSKMGGLSSDLVAHDHQFWRLFTCIWLHAGLIHVFINMFSLLYVGIRFEQEFGCGRIGSIYFLSGIGGSLFAELFLQHRISAGASTPLFGLLGAMLSELITNWSLYEVKCPTLITLVFISVGNLAIGVFPHNDNFAHIGGFIFGFLLGFMFLMKPQHDWGDQTMPPRTKPKIRSKYSVFQLFLWIAAVVLLAAGFIMGVILAVRGVDGNANCSWCHYLSCVPSSWWKCDDNGSSGRRRATCNYVISGNYMFMRCENNQRTQLYNGVFSASDIRYLASIQYESDLYESDLVF